MGCKWFCCIPWLMCEVRGQLYWVISHLSLYACKRLNSGYSIYGNFFAWWVITQALCTLNFKEDLIIIVWRIVNLLDKIIAFFPKSRLNLLYGAFILMAQHKSTDRTNQPGNYIAEIRKLKTNMWLTKLREWSVCRPYKKTSRAMKGGWDEKKMTL